MVTLRKRINDIEKKLSPPEKTSISVVVVKTVDGVKVNALTGEVVPEPKPGDKVIRVGFDLEAI